MGKILNVFFPQDLAACDTRNTTAGTQNRKHKTRNQKVFPTRPSSPVPELSHPKNNYLTEMCSGSVAGSYVRLVDFMYHSTPRLSVMKKRRRYPNHHIPFPNLQTRKSKPENRKTRNLKPETRNPKSETRNTKPVAREFFSPVPRRR